jgi:hypothetical protein
MRMSTVVRPELELARAVRVTARAGVRDFLGGVRPRAGMENYADGVFRCRPVDANRGDETSDQFVHLPPNSAPSAPHYQFVHLPYGRLRKQRCRSEKVTMRCFCASEGIPREPGGGRSRIRLSPGCQTKQHEKTGAVDRKKPRRGSPPGPRPRSSLATARFYRR